jgi:uncharacterized membrane protein (UPF0127 family)
MLWIALSAFLQNTPDLKALDLQKVRIAFGEGSCSQLIPSPQQLQAQIVTQKASMEKGLSRRPQPLSKEEGMLFIYPEPRMAQIWMKDTLIPLKVLFFDGDSRMSNHFEMPVEPDPSHPEKTYSSTRPVRAALEVSPEIPVSTWKNPVLCIRK